MVWSRKPASNNAASAQQHPSKRSKIFPCQPSIHHQHTAATATHCGHSDKRSLQFLTQNIPGTCGRLHAARKTPDALGQGQGAHKGCRSKLWQVYLHKHVRVCAYAVYIECTDSEIRSLESGTNIQRRFGAEPCIVVCESLWWGWKCPWTGSTRQWHGCCGKLKWLELMRCDFLIVRYGWRKGQMHCVVASADIIQYSGDCSSLIVTCHCWEWPHSDHGGERNQGLLVHTLYTPFPSRFSARLATVCRGCIELIL